MEGQVYEYDALIKNTEILQASSLFRHNIKVTCTNTQLTKLLKIESHQTLYILLNSSTKPKYTNKVSFVRCDTMYAQHKQKFIEFYSNILGYSIHKLQYEWIETLYDLKHAHYLHSIGITNDPYTQQESKVFNLKSTTTGILTGLHTTTDPWIWIRYKYNYYVRANRPDIAACYKHFELWSRKHIPNEETMIWLCQSLENDVQAILHNTTCM